MIFILLAFSNLSIDSDVCKFAQNNLPLFRRPVFGRGNEIEELAGKLQSEETRIVNIYGQTATGKSTLAISLGYEMAVLGMDVHYIDLNKTSLLSESSDDQVTFHITSDTFLILDNCKVSESEKLNNLLANMYKDMVLGKLRIVLTSHEKILIKLHQIRSRVEHFQIKQLGSALYPVRYYRSVNQHTQTPQEHVELTQSLLFSVICVRVELIQQYSMHSLAQDLYDRVCHYIDNPKVNV